MRTYFKSNTWRITSSLLLFVLVFTQAAGFSARAAPPSQQDGTGAPLAPGDHLVTAFVLTPDTPNILHTDQSVNLTFQYISNEPSGVRIFARPFTNGALSPNYSAHGSPLYPTGSGSGNGYFTIASGTVVVDQIRIQMLNADQSVLLFETFLPVYYLFTDANHMVRNISLAPDTPDVLAFNQNVELTFDYITRQQNGVRIWARPFTNGALTPNYAAHGSPIYPAGSGSGSGFFTITSRTVVVDQIRIQMWDADQTVLLFEAFLPVYYRFMNQTNIVTNIEFRPDTPNVFKYNDNVSLSFNYTNNQDGGVRIFARPFSGPGLSPSYAAHGSPLYPFGSGSGSGFFTLTAGPTVVDRVRIQMWDANQTKLLFEAFLPVNLLWAGSGPPPGPDMSLNAIEVTQAIQDLNNSVDLVAGKRTYVRVHARSPVNQADVYATLSGKHGWVNLAPILSPGNPGGDITVRTSPDRGQINDSFWFELPSGWTTAGDLTLTARLDPNNAKFDPNTSNNTSSITVNFKSTPPLRLRLVDVQYTSGGNTYLAANSHLDALESWLRRAYPISNLQVTRQTMIYPTNGLPNVDTLHQWLTLIKLLRMIFNGEDGRVVYYGVVDDGGGFMRGKALGIPSTIAAGPSGTGTWGWDFDGSYNDWYGGHEIGHTRGRFHAEYCGATGGAPYPYPGGRISPDLTGNGAIYGFDITTRAIYPPTWEDVMTYCNNEWVSDFTYEGIRSYLVGSGIQSPEPQSVTASDFLAVVGLADLDSNTANLESAYVISQDATLPLPEPGDWSIVLLDNTDQELASYPFAPDELTDAEESPGRPAVIGEIVPWVVGTVKVEFRYQGAVVATRTASANPPSVTITSPAPGTMLPDGPFDVTWTGSDPDGDALTYSVLYSNDGGLNWQTLATNLSASELTLNTDLLPGGTGMVRVLVSDGLLSGQATSGTFTLPKHAPSVQIVMPSENQVFFPTQQIDLQGSAYDLEDGTLGDASFQWSSSIDGDLGTGASLGTSELTTGEHIITLTVTDSDGMTSQAQRTITIAPEDTPETVELEASPFLVGLVLGLGEPVEPYTVTLRSSGDTEIDWTANEDIPWLSLSVISGTTPSDLVLTIDPGLLHIGSNTGKIIIMTSGPGRNTIELMVNVQVTGYSVLLPLITR
jgi:hypothetical protein